MFARWYSAETAPAPHMAPTSTQLAARTLRGLFSGLDGFEIARAQERRVHKTHSSSVYGELMPTATFALLEAMNLSHKDVFADLGCGIGKVVLAAAIATPARRCIGIELAADRIAQARVALQRARDQELRWCARVDFREQNLLSADLDAATILYCCSTAFPPKFMRRLLARITTLPRVTKLVSVQELDEHKNFVLDEEFRLDTSWQRRAPVYSYRVLSTA